MRTWTLQICPRALFTSSIIGVSIEQMLLAPLLGDNSQLNIEYNVVKL